MFLLEWKPVSHAARSGLVDFLNLESKTQVDVGNTTVVNQRISEQVPNSTTAKYII